MKVNPFLLFAAATITLALQLTLLNFLDVISLKPDLVFIWVIISSFYLPLRSAIFTNWSLGILIDLTSNSGFGTFGFIYLVIGLFIFLLREIFYSEDIFTRMSIATGSLLICHLAYSFGLVIFKSAFSVWFAIFKSLGITIYTGVFIFLIFFIMDKISGLMLAKQLREELK
jgi:rod shape-determining protein MreD